MAKPSDERAQFIQRTRAACNAWLRDQGVGTSLVEYYLQQAPMSLADFALRIPDCIPIAVYEVIKEDAGQRLPEVCLYNCLACVRNRTANETWLVEVLGRCMDGMVLDGDGDREEVHKYKCVLKKIATELQAGMSFTDDKQIKLWLSRIFHECELLIAG